MKTNDQLTELRANRNALQAELRHVDAVIADLELQQFNANLLTLRVDATECRIVWRYSIGEPDYGCWKPNAEAFEATCEWLHYGIEKYGVAVEFVDGKVIIPRFPRAGIRHEHVRAEVYLEGRNGNE